MTLEHWIKQNKAEIDSIIKRHCPNCSIEDDDERENWVMNNEGLYLWAEMDGVEL